MTPGSAPADLVKALAHTRIRQLQINHLFDRNVMSTDRVLSEDDANHNRSALVLFADSLVTSASSTLEDLDMMDPRFKYWTGLSPERQLGLQYDWAANITRALDLHRDRRRSIPIFEQFSQTHANRPRFAKVFAVRPTIVFGYMRSDQFNMLTALDAHGPGEPSSHAEAFVAVQKGVETDKKRSPAVSPAHSKRPRKEL